MTKKQVVIQKDQQKVPINLTITENIPNWKKNNKQKAQGLDVPETEKPPENPKIERKTKHTLANAQTGLPKTPNYQSFPFQNSRIFLL